MAGLEAKMTSKGQITLPAKLRAAMRLEIGDKVVFAADGDGAYRLLAKKGSLADLKGIVRSGARVARGEMAHWMAAARSRSAPAGLKRRGA